MFHRFLILICALYLGGAHWMLLQMTAWTGMLIVRSQEAPIKEAVESTFDGEHPCQLCAAIKEAQQEEQKREQERPLIGKAQDYKFLLSSQCVLPVAVCSGEMAWLEFPCIIVARGMAPPIPPPRA